MGSEVKKQTSLIRTFRNRSSILFKGNVLVAPSVNNSRKESQHSTLDQVFFFSNLFTHLFSFSKPFLYIKKKVFERQILYSKYKTHTHRHTIFNSTLQVARLQQISLGYKERRREVLHRAITKTKSQHRNFGILYERHEVKITSAVSVSTALVTVLWCVAFACFM